MGQVERSEQNQIRIGSRAEMNKLHMSGSGQTNIRNQQFKLKCTCIFTPKKLHNCGPSKNVIDMCLMLKSKINLDKFQQNENLIPGCVVNMKPNLWFYTYLREMKDNLC